MPISRFAKSLHPRIVSASRRVVRRPSLVVENLESRRLLTGGPTPGPGQTVPTAHDDVIDTDAGNPVAVPVLANDSHPSGITFGSVVVGSQPTHGKIGTIDAESGVIMYDPAQQFSGTDTFTYTFRDIYGVQSNPATVTVVVNRPVANDDFANTVSATPVVIDAAGNDADPDGNDHLVLGSVALVSGPAHGSAALNGDGTITYTASRGFEGTDRLTYTISDKAGAVSNPGTVTIAVSAPPAQAGTVLNDDAMDTDEGNPVTVPVLGNDVSPVGFDPTTVKLASQPSHGTASVDPGSGAITYSPLSQFFGTDTFSYTVKDKNGGISGPGQVTVVVNRPTANDDFAETFGTAPVAINLAGNDTDPDGNNHLDPSTVALVGFPAHGTITTLSNGQVTYVANPGFSGTDRFTYTIKDMAGATSNTATATVVTDLGQISGRVFFDDNADGTQEPGEAGMAGQVFYIDAHGDGIRHADDASTTSDAEGQYTFKGLAAGSYVVRQDTGGNANLVLTGTSGATYTATVGAANPVVVGTPDGNLVISPVATVVVTPQPFPQGPADAATKFLQGVYRGVVGTTVTPAEVAKPLAKLEHSAGLRNRTAAAQSVWESAAHRQAAVTKDYQSILGRAPTASELAKLSKHFVAKGGEVGVAASLLSTPEFRARAGSGNANYAAALYQQVLGRSATASEQAALATKLDHHKLTATSAAVKVLDSPEGAALLVNSLYTAILQHPSDANTLARLSDKLGTGKATVESIGVRLLASSEYYARASAASQRA